jgi:hypothetical protein
MSPIAFERQLHYIILLLRTDREIIYNRKYCLQNRQMYFTIVSDLMFAFLRADVFMWRK